MRRAQVNVVEILDSVRDAYRIPLSKDVKLSWNYPSELPALNTDGDELKQILQNLINNAVKFIPKGSITVTVEYVPEDVVIRFVVEDTRVKIPNDKIPVIFEMFRQGDSSETRQFSGVGLGLYIVKQQTKLLGGKRTRRKSARKGLEIHRDDPV